MKSIFGLQRQGKWLCSELCQRPQFGTTAKPIWIAPNVDTALERALLIKLIHGVSVEPKRVIQND